MHPSTQNFLRKLILIQFFLYILLVFSDGIFYGMLPEELQNFLTEQTVPFTQADFLYQALTAGTWISELLGLRMAWKSKERAKYFLAAATGLSFLVTAYSAPSVQVPLQIALNDLATLIGGILLALLWLPTCNRQSIESSATLKTEVASLSKENRPG